MNSKTLSPIPYPSYIPEARRPTKPPRAVVENGKSVFGAFDGPIENVNIKDADHPLSPRIPNFLNSARIKEWEAYEVCFDQGFICGAIYDLGAAVFNILIFYDSESGKVTAQQSFGPPKKCVMNSLINSVNTLRTGCFSAKIDNQFQSGKVYIKSSFTPTASGKIPMSTDLIFTSISEPTVTVMPLGENRPLYTHKELFGAEGTITIGGRVFTMNENSLGIIDDHKGYYPRHMHYDWVTCMGMLEGKPTGVNLCRNQALEPDVYSENILWLDGRLHPLPTVSFAHTGEGNWQVNDEHGAVSILFHIDDCFKLSKHVPPIKANYTAPYGKVEGFVRDSFGNQIILDGLLAMGEDINYHMV